MSATTEAEGCDLGAVVAGILRHRTPMVTSLHFGSSGTIPRPFESRTSPSFRNGMKQRGHADRLLPASTDPCH